MSDKPINLKDFRKKKKKYQHDAVEIKMTNLAIKIDELVLQAVNNGLKPQEVLMVVANRLGAIGAVEFKANCKSETFELALEVATKRYQKELFPPPYKDGDPDDLNGPPLNTP